MSANDYILINWVKNRYKVTHRDAETNHILSNIGQEKNLEEAVRKANEYQYNSPIEYGLSIVTKPRKRQKNEDSQ